MAMITQASLASEREAEGIAFAREVLRIEAEALERVRDRLGVSITRAAELIYRSTGSVIITGMGKAGLVGQKLAATLASKAPIAVRYILEAVHGGLEIPLSQAQVFEATLFGLAASTEDMREGTKAFLEKRRPDFKGR